MIEVDYYRKILDDRGVVKIDGYFDKKLCENFLLKYKDTLYNTVNPVVPGNENNGNNLKIGNEFYGKKPTHWEVFKINLEEKSIFQFVDLLSIFNLGDYKSTQLVVRKKFNSNVLPCHVDNLYNESVVYYNCGIYLNDTSEHDRVYFVEGTHKTPTTSCTIEDKNLKKTYIDAKAGDLIIHNSYVWHGSDNNDTEGRVTLYIKFQK